MSTEKRHFCINAGAWVPETNDRDPGTTSGTQSAISSAVEDPYTGNRSSSASDCGRPDSSFRVFLSTPDFRNVNAVARLKFRCCVLW